MNVDRKPFLTIDEQIELLKSRGMEVDAHLAADVLRREGYYAVVNGYKDFFLDEIATRAAGDDRYKEGATFSQLAALYEKDRMLREIVLPLFMRAESIVRTAIAYNYSDRFREPDAYLDSATYCERDEYFDPAHFIRNRNRLIETLQGAHDNRELHSDAVSHYLDEYGHVPLWVLVNSLTFGNISNMYSLLKESVRNAVCKTVGEGAERKRISTKQMRTMLTTLVQFRNVCAHNGRFYCYRAGKHRDRTFADAMRALRALLGDAYTRGAEERIAWLLGFKETRSEVQAVLLAGLDVKVVRKGERLVLQ